MGIKDIQKLTESIKNDNSATEDPRVLNQLEKQIYEDFHASKKHVAQQDLAKQNYLIAGLMFLSLAILFSIISVIVTHYIYLPNMKPEASNFTLFFFTYGLISYIPALLLMIPSIISLWCTRKSTSDKIRIAGFVLMIITIVYFLVMIGFCVYFACI